MTAPGPRRARAARVRRPQLITYPDSLGGDLAALTRVLAGPLGAPFGGLHILPPFPSSGDRGFAPLTQREIDPRFGAWADIEGLATDRVVVLDLIVNHVSARSPEFADFRAHGRASAHADLFLTLDKLWPGGVPAAADLERVAARRRPPYSAVPITDTGETELVWTTFGRDDPSEQVDLDLASPAALERLDADLATLAAHRATGVRFDAVGYVVKRAGTSCFLVEPDVWHVLRRLVRLAAAHGLEALAEVHAVGAARERIVAAGAWAYDFALPGLVLDALRRGDGARLVGHLAGSPARQVTVLDCHDGIPIQPDLTGLVPVGDLRAIVEPALAAGANASRVVSTAALPDPPFDVHQLNATLASILEGDDDALVVARAIQLFAPGVPQVYYVGLLAGQNDLAAVERTGDGRAINRHDYSEREIEAALGTEVVRRLLRLLEVRDRHPAFDGRPAYEAEPGGRMVARWQAGGAPACSLEVDLGRRRAILDGGRGFGRFVA